MDSTRATPTRSQVTVCIDSETLGRLHAYVRSTPGELTLLGTAEADLARNEIRVQQLFLPFQVSSASHTQVDAESLARLLVEAVQSGVDVSTLKVWLHSHGTMQVFFSSTDEENIRDAFPQAPWVLSLVVNRAGEMKARLSLYTPFRIEIDDLPVTVGLPAGLEENIQREVQEKVRPGYDYPPASNSPARSTHSGNGAKPALSAEKWNPTGWHPRPGD